MIITFTNVIGAIRNAISSVITTNLKMWLGFQTSETIGKNIYDGGITNPANGGTFTDNGNGTFTVTGDGTPNLGIGVRDFDADYLTVGGTYKFYAQGANTTVAVYDTAFNLLTSGINSVEFQATTSSIKLYISPTNGVSATYSDVEVRQLTQITPDKSDNNNVGELFTGKALEFDGSTDYVDVDGFKMSGNVSTFAFWINSNDTLGRMIDINPNRFIISFNNNQLSLYDGSWKNFGTISTNVWNRCVVVTNGTSAKCYVNGVQLGVEKTINAINIGSATDTIIGANVAHNQSFFDGEMSDFQIYNAAWSTDDIAYDYANPNKLAIDNPSTSLVVTNLKAYWALSEGDGLVAYDSGTNLEEDVVVNGDFALDSNWSEGAGWDIDVANNRITRTAQSGSTSASQNISFVSGKSYSITYTLDVSAGSFLIRLGGDGVLDTPARSVDDTYTEVVTANGNYTTLNLRALDGTFAGSISNVSVREVTASDHGGNINGADYVDAQPRIPQLGMMNWSKGSNLLTYSNDFTEWLNPSNIAITPNYGTSPIGTQDASRVVFTGSSQLLRLSFTTTTNLTASIYMKGSGTIKFGMNTGEEVQTLSTNWQRFIVSRTAGATSITFNTYGGTTARDIQVWGAQVEVGTSAGAYRLTDGGATLNSTVIPNPTIPTQDILGNAVRDRLNSFNLDGSGYSSVANNSSIKPTSALSIECWIKTPDVSSASKYISDADVGATRFFLMQVGSKARFKIATTEIDSAANLTDNTWHYIAGTWNGSTMTLYVDEETPVTISKSGTITYDTDDLFIGSRLGTGEYFDGLISDVRLYDRALTSDEVENNYNAGLSAHTND